ncbi:MAG TPA: hypothetical protein VHS58_11920, partial [Acetobacteraceae bacterium]|nr:hypothetical protein [Acetobacteraceae bacterium]
LTTAEGVETVEQFERLKAIGYHQIQGYYIGRPAPDPYAVIDPEEDGSADCARSRGPRVKVLALAQ